MKEGRYKGRKDYRKGGRKNRIIKDIKAGRTMLRKEGRKEGRKDDAMGGRKEGRTVIKTVKERCKGRKVGLNEGRAM